MSDKIEEIIKEIAARHGIAVGRDDPILVLQTINDRLMQDSQAAQQRILESFKSELENIAHQWSEDSKSKAEKILNAALAASTTAMEKTMKEGASAAATAVCAEFDNSTSKLSDALIAAHKVSVLNMAAASLAVIAAAIALWASI